MTSRSTAAAVLPQVRTEKIELNYRDKRVRGRKLTVSSSLPLPLEKAWANVQRPALLQFIARGMIRFRFLDGEVPARWVTGQTYRLRMYIFGFIPFGGIHYLHVEKVDEARHQIITREWDSGAKVWNHTISMRAVGPECVHYTDEIIIYGGLLTGLITVFAKYFYQHRQRRWQIVAREGLSFARTEQCALRR